MNIEQHKNRMLNQYTTLADIAGTVELMTSATKVLKKNLDDRWENSEEIKKNPEVYVHGTYHYDFEMTLEEFTEEVSHECFKSFLVPNAEVIFNYERSNAVRLIALEILEEKTKEIKYV